MSPSNSQPQMPASQFGLPALRLSTFSRLVSFGERACFALFVAGGLVIGCGGSGQKSTAKTAEGEALPIVFQHEACDLNSGEIEKIDVRADGRPGMVRVLSGTREVCRMLDFNHDGIPDTFVYLDDQGRVRRRESDFDRDGKVDEVDIYANGVVVRKDRATTLDGRFHTWDFYEAGKLHRRLRDSDGDGKVDQWWAWPNLDKPECPVIRTDLNGDGQPEDSTAVDECAASAAPGAFASSATTPPASSSASSAVAPPPGASSAVPAKPLAPTSSAALLPGVAPASSSSVSAVPAGSSARSLSTGATPPIPSGGGKAAGTASKSGSGPVVAGAAAGKASGEATPAAKPSTTSKTLPTTASSAKGGEP